jgi:hypothetical protein
VEHRGHGSFKPLSHFHINGKLWWHSMKKIALLSDFVESNQKYRKVIKAVITQWVKDYQDGKIAVTSVKDLQCLLKMEQELQKTLLDNTKEVSQMTMEDLET